MTGTSLVSYEQRWEQEAQKAAQNEPLSSGTWLTAKGGQLVIDDNPLPGNQAAVVVLDSFRENTYYAGRYDPENVLPPVCYALGRDADPMFPHLDMQKDLNYFKPQHWGKGQSGEDIVLGCEGCPMNEWGSAEQGKGKACQNRRRLTVIPAGMYTPKPGSNDFDLQLFSDSKHFAEADAAFFKLSVTSVSNWSKYVNKLFTNVRRPPYGVVTKIQVVPHQKHQFEVVFDLIDLIPDDLAETIMGRHDAAAQMPLVGYAPPDEERLAKAQGAPAGGFRQGGFRR